MSTDLIRLVSLLFGLTIVMGQDCGVTFDSTSWSTSEDTGTNPAASVTISAPGWIVTLHQVG